MREGRHARADVVAVGAALLSAGWLVAAVWVPIALAPLVALAVVATCALAALRRPRSRLYLALGVIGFWLCAGLAGAVLLQGDSAAGLAWIVVALFAVPLPVVPWLYARTFEDHGGGRAADHPSAAGGVTGPGASTVHSDSTRSPGPAPRTPVSRSSLSSRPSPLAPPRPDRGA
jgi:hypothetical protein